MAAWSCYKESPNVEVAEVGFVVAAVDEYEDQQNRMAYAVS